jgi:hypothetical protein
MAENVPLPSSNAVSQAGDYSTKGNTPPMIDGLEFDCLLVDLKFLPKSGKKQQPAWTIKVEVLGSNHPDKMTEGRKYDLYFNLGAAHDMGHKRWVSFLALCKGLPPNTPFDSDSYRNELYAAANAGKLGEKEIVFHVSRRVDRKDEAAVVEGKAVLITKEYANDSFSKLDAA